MEKIHPPPLPTIAKPNRNAEAALSFSFSMSLIPKVSNRNSIDLKRCATIRNGCFLLCIGIACNIDIFAHWCTIVQNITIANMKFCSFAYWYCCPCEEPGGLVHLIKICLRIRSGLVFRVITIKKLSMIFLV